ncbi:MAG: heparinase II/III-family protein [Acidobacteria bacterium]|nr:heparinase II/III-family protein [Acidobacteriota bacterium]
MKANREQKNSEGGVSRVALVALTLSSFFSLSGAAGAQVARAQESPGQTRQAAVVRPRMLVGERDPLTGFQTLRARYDAGARPPDDLAGWALTYLLKGDEGAARRAVEEMRRARTPERVGSRTYPEFVKWSLAFDWLYNYPGFDAALKDRVAGELVKAAAQMLQDQSLRDPRLSMYHNYTVRYLTLAAFALTAVEGHPSVEAEAALLRERTRRVWEHILDLTDFITPDGGYHESMDYQRITYAPMALLAELDRTALNSDPALRYSVFRHYTATHLYKALPDGTTSRLGDNEFPYMRSQDNVVLGYAVHRFKDPYAAWMLRESGWPDTKDWLIPITKFLWDDPTVAPRDPAKTSEAELSRQHHFRGVGHLVMRDGFGPDSTWVEFVAGPYLAKHQHLDQLHFAVYRKGYLATESGADYTDTESPHYLNYYRRTIAHNSVLVYDRRERFFWAENLWPAANDGGQRMDSSRYWNTARSREDFQNTRELWALARMEAVGHSPGAYHYARGDATRAYSARKVELFTRELVYTPSDNVLFVFDRVRATDPTFRKTWLLHGVSEPSVKAAGAGRDAGHGGTAYGGANEFTYEDGGGALRVHTLLPRERELTKRGGRGFEFWTPGDERGGAWGSGQNWPLDPPEGGPLPADPYLRKMWKTFWGEDFEKLLPSNTRAVVPAAWRVEVSPAKPSKEDAFLNVMEIGDRGRMAARKVELADGSNLTGAAVEGGVLALFAAADARVTEGEATVPDVLTTALLVTGLVPDAKYELQLTGGRANWRGGLYNGVPQWQQVATADDSGVIYLPSFKGQRDGRLRLRLLSKT